MKIRNYIYYTFSILIAIAAITACQDKFDEADFLKQQQEAALALQQAEAKADSTEAALQHQYEMEYLNQVLANGLAADEAERAAQLAALNQAGLLLSYTLVVQEDGVAVPGVDVSITNSGSGGTVTATTDAGGAAIFTNGVVVGSNSVTISKTNYMTASFVVDFGVPSTTTISGLIIPILRTETSIVPIYSIAGTSTAIIKGKVTIETDLTNDAKEVPQDIEIQAVFDLNPNGIINGNGSSITGYTVDFGNLGIGSVDNTTGEYSIEVPAGVNGQLITLLIPNIETTQRIAVDRLNGEDIASEYRDVPTLFGFDYQAAYDAIGLVAGAYAEFPAPPAPGRGFTFGNFQRVGRPLVFNLDWDITDPVTSPYEPGGDIVYQVTDFGSDYIASPDVAITDPTGSDATAEAHIHFAVDGLTFDATAGGYANNEIVIFNLWYDSDGDDVIDTDLGFILNITADGTGDITQIEIDVALADAITNGDTYFDPQDPQSVANHVDKFVLTDGAAITTIDVTSTSFGELYGMGMIAFGDDYTNPKFTFTGGGGTTQAVMNILQIGTYWTFEVDNAGNTADYSKLPSNIDFEMTEAENNLPTTFIGNGFMRISSTGVETAVADIIDALTTQNGDINFTDQTATYRTDDYSAIEPMVIVDEIDADITIAEVNIDANGQITNLFDIDSGEGYNNRYEVTIMTITGAPGSGAAIQLTSFVTQSSGEVIWNGTYITTDGGSGYLQNLNVDGFENFTGNTILFVEGGKEYVNDIKYGTGDKQEDVN